jgi:NAD(P)-dependent dehydrogenase (short-subunit alcohol dehydrogenase family)
MASLPFPLPSLVGKVFLVTGGNTGVGFHTVKELAKRGARVYMGARSPEKATAAINEIQAESPNASSDIHFLQMDLLDLQSVVAAAKQFKAKESRLHGLVNNAGIMATPFALSADGFEAQWQTNYLSHWVLTWHLLDALIGSTLRDADDGGLTAVAAGTARVVNVTSDGHNFAPKVGINFKDINQVKAQSFSRYGQSKVGNILHVKQLNKLFGPDGTSKRGVLWTAAVHPGHLDTNLNKQTNFPKFVNTLLRTLGAYSPPSEGALNSLFAVASPEFKGSYSGEYFVPGQKKKQPSKVARDMELAGRLWDWTEEEMRKRKLLE